ncbi:anti-sigma factor family protein [Myxococcota bacterium]
MSESCKKIEHLIEPYLDEELSKSKKETVEQHLHACDSCKLTLEAFKLQGGLLRERIEAEAQKVDFTGFEDRVLARIAKEKPPAFTERAGAWVREVAYYYRTVWITSLATAVLLLAVLVPLLSRDTTPGDEPDTKVAEADNQVIIDSMEYAGQRSMIFTVSKNNTTVIWLYDYDRAEGQDQGDDI